MGLTPSASAATAETDTAPAKLTDTLADTSVVHAIPRTCQIAGAGAQDLARPGRTAAAASQGPARVTDVTVNDWCFSVTVICDPSTWTSDRLCVWLQLLECGRRSHRTNLRMKR